MELLNEKDFSRFCSMDNQRKFEFLFNKVNEMLLEIKDSRKPNTLVRNGLSKKVNKKSK